MSFFDKMKTGMNQVKDKAAQTVEITRISSQISNKRKERSTQLEKLGEIVHQADLNGTLQESLEHIQSISTTITQVELEIESWESHLMKVKGEKRCDCGAVIPVDSRFCNSCGKEVKEEQLSPVSTETEAEQDNLLFCTSCGSPIEGQSAFCTSCGAKSE